MVFVEVIVVEEYTVEDERLVDGTDVEVVEEYISDSGLSDLREDPLCERWDECRECVKIDCTEEWSGFMLCCLP